LYDVDKPPQDITIKVASIENFVRVRVNGKVANVDAILLDGSKLDTMQLEGAAR
jgi:hypothetical protein